MTPHTTIGPDTLLDTVRSYEEKGFTGQFSVRPNGMVYCHTCGAEEPAAQTPLQALHRFEGESDPADEMVAAALECVSCGGWGTMVLTYGPSASSEEMQVLRELLDDREHAVLPPGL